MSAPAAGRVGERGSALLVALLVLVLATTAGLLVAVGLALDLRAQRDDDRRVRLGALADSALAEAIADLALDPDSAGFLPHPFGGGEIESEVRTLAAGRLQVTARARLAHFERVILAEVVFGPHGPRVVAWRLGTAPREAG